MTKNITLAIDSNLHRKVKILAAKHDMSLSKLVTFCLETMVDDLEKIADIAEQDGFQPMPSSLKEKAIPFTDAPKGEAFTPTTVDSVDMGPDGQPYQVDGQWVWTPNGKPRQPGAMRGLLVMSDDFDDWPEDIMASFADWPYDDGPSS